MIKINEDKLVQISVIGEISSPSMGSPYRITANGELKVFPGTGGITYNVRIGDNACGWQADHVEPGVTIKNSNESNNGALNILSCIGNAAKIVSGDAKGKTGYVVGKHGGCEHVLIDFDPKILDELAIGDKIQIKAQGVGLEFIDHPEIKIFNISSDLLKKIQIKEKKGKTQKLQIPVTHLVPAKVMGSGIGKDNVNRGDYDIQLFDENVKKEYNLANLKLGDFVAVIDADNTYGRIYREGAVSIGVIVHSDCVIAGHGPGFMTVFTSKDGLIEPVIDKNANLLNYLYQD
ncbi:MAG: DUF4438 domain-containing protein [Candidatus Melainabacteria bacterium GWF2_32_7]|nr:MAG: DUF4438 domain-containing protein [Candidatus Melainabacteria bacterium GWF2_32_7]